jgi:hypothetical protein
MFRLRKDAASHFAVKQADGNEPDDGPAEVPGASPGGTAALAFTSMMAIVAIMSFHEGAKMSIPVKHGA